MNTHEKIVKARAQMVQSARFFGFLALRLEPKATKRVETLATDGRNLFYNPEWVDRTEVNEVTGVCAKMALQTALLHHTRRRGRDEQRWKQACEYASVPLVKKAGFTLPPSADLYDNQNYYGKSAEAIFPLLPEPEEDQDGEDQGQSEGAGGAGATGEDEGEPGEGDGAQEPGDEPGDSEDDGDSGDTGDEPGDSEDDGDSGDTGDEPGENPDEGPKDAGEDAAGSGQVLDASNEDGSAPSPAETKEMENQMQIAVAQANNMANSAGQGSTDQERILKDIKEAQVDWTEELRRFVQQAAKDDYDWSRPNRRFAHQGMYLPRLHSEKLGVMVVALDASGSTSAWIDRFGRELGAIVEDTQPKAVYVMWTTDRVVHVDRFEPQDWPGKLNSHGLGGTDFRPAFKYVEENILPEEEVACMVYLTDLDGAAPEREPDYPVLWACCTGIKAPWGEVVRLKN